MKIFLNWIRESLSSPSYCSMALCLYRFKANLFPDFPLMALLDTLDKRVSKVSLTSFSSFFWFVELFCSSSFSSWPSSS